MVKGRMNKWRPYLLISLSGLLLFAAFAPLSETPHRVLSVMGLLGLLGYLVTDPVSRRELAHFVILLAALVLLALLLSIHPKWAVFGAIGVSALSILWEMGRLQLDDDAAERKPLP